MERARPAGAGAQSHRELPAQPAQAPAGTGSPRVASKREVKSQTMTLGHQRTSPWLHLGYINSLPPPKWGGSDTRFREHCCILKT